MKLDDLIFDTISQKIIRALIQRPEKVFYEKQVAKLADVSVGGANSALKQLLCHELVTRNIEGRMNFYQVNLENPIVRQTKILFNLISIKPFVDHIRPCSLKVILFGSAAEGTNLKDSDFDLFAVSNEPEKVQGAHRKNKLKNRISLIVKDPVEAEKMKTQNAVFEREIERGIIIYERGE